MIIDCPQCEAKVDAKVLKEHIGGWIDTDPFETKAILLVCPACKSPLLALQELYHVDIDRQVWGTPIRVWPEPERYPDKNIPQLVRDSLLEARKCLRATANKSCAVMCGRALEGIFTEYKITRGSFQSKLKTLLDKGYIDKRIYEWGDAIREKRNIGAHATEERISKQDAQDVLEFTQAICEYVFVLAKKFDNFKERIQKAKDK
ncbi:MAG: DUF4145 domain-containing protein [Nitrospinae bacterium]|nr:DUF4145 domain-containing protein [Nitrospinota bacterium]